MLVSPVSVTGLGKVNPKLSFGQNSPAEKPSAPVSASAVKTVPVMVLMAMNPSLLNAKLPENFTDQNNIVFVAPETLNNTEEATYVMSPDLEQYRAGIKNPYGWELFDALSIKYKGVVKSSNGTTYNVLFTSLADKKANEVDEIYLVPKGDMGKAYPGEYHPPRVKRLIVHDMPNGEQFSTVLCGEEVLNSKNEWIAYREREIPIDDKTAQLIFDTLQGYSRSPYVDKTNIKWSLVDTPVLTKEIYNVVAH